MRKNMEKLEQLEQEFNPSEMECFKAFYDAGDKKLLLINVKKLTQLNVF